MKRSAVAVLGIASGLVVLACFAGCKKEPPGGNPEVLLSMALVNLQRGNLDVALRQLQEAQPRDSSNPDILNTMGIVYGNKGDFISAEKCFTQAIQIDGDNPQFYINRGKARLNLKKHDEALADFDKAMSPEMGFEAPQIAYFCKGETYFDLQLYDQAAENYRAALARVPQDPQIRARLGQTLYKIGRVDEALKEFEECAKANPRFPDVQFQMGKAYLERTENGKACAAFKKYVELAPDGVDAEAARRYVEFLRKENSCPEDAQPQPRVLTR